MKKLMKQLKKAAYKKMFSSQQETTKKEITLEVSLAQNRHLIKNALGNSSDIIIRNLTVNGVQCSLVYIADLADENKVQEYIVEPLIKNFNDKEHISLNWLSNKVASPKVRFEGRLDEILQSINAGQTVLLLEGETAALILETLDEQYRSVTMPPTELVVRGPHEGFIESINKNVGMVRKRLKTPNFRVIDKQLGLYTNTSINICYIDGIAKDEVVEEVKKRLDQIELDGVLESGYIEEFIEDAPFSPFPTIGITQKPDVVAAKLLEGRVAIFCDGTPAIMTVPFLFIENFQTADDYYNRPYFSSIFRLIRLISIFISFMLPSLYVAIVNYHPDFLPTDFLMTIASASQGVPFPKVIEVLFMGLIFEILREAGLRIPTPIGQTVSIVGALVLGEAAVGAGLVGQPVIIVTALVAISSFAVNFSLTATLILMRLVFLMGGAVLGLFGVNVVFLALIIHLASIRSFGVNFLSPLAPMAVSSWKDTFLRLPWWLMGTRPTRLSENPVRQKKIKQPKQVIADD